MAALRTPFLPSSKPMLGGGQSPRERAGTIVWFAYHEGRLAWRDWLWLMSGGGRRSTRRVALGLIAIALFLHGFAYLVVYGHADLSGPPDKRMLVVLTGTLALYGSLMLSQAMEAVTRAFYGRADLDLILSSPGCSLAAIRRTHRGDGGDHRGDVAGSGRARAATRS